MDRPFDFSLAVRATGEVLRLAKTWRDGIMRFLRYLVVLGLPALALGKSWSGLEPTLRFWLVAAWATSIIIAWAMGIAAVYGKMAELEDLRNRARIDARMTPEIRDRIQRIKQLTGEIQNVVDGRVRPERLGGKLRLLGSLAGGLGDFDGVRSATLFYRESAMDLFAALDEAEPGDAKRQRWQAGKKQAFKLRGCE